MASPEAPQSIPLDEQPFTGLATRDTALPHNGPEQLAEQQPPLLVFPSGAVFPLYRNQNAHTPPQVQIAPEMALPLHHTRDQGYHWACLQAEQAAANGSPSSLYHVHKMDEGSMEIQGSGQAFWVSYDNAAGRLHDIVVAKRDQPRAGVEHPDAAFSPVPRDEVEPQFDTAPANDSRYTDNDNFAPLMYWLEPLVAHILWQSKTVAGYIPPTLIADAMQEGFLKLWQRLHDEPEFIETNTKSYVAQWVAWQGKDRLLYGNGHKRWARHTVPVDALQQRV